MTLVSPPIDSSAIKLDTESVKKLISKAGLQVPAHELGDWSILLGSFEQSIRDVLQEDDDLPIPDLSKYPRTDIAIPSDATQSDKGAWATTCVAKSTAPTSSLLAGKKVALKDNIAFAGMRTLNGLDPFDRPWVPTYDATVATRIMDASAVIVGKATCEAACMEPSSDTSWTGVVHNPYADGYSCGGSSSGSGRVVVTGSADMALGCDQGGSVRIPASYCGLVGFKATWGLVPYSGILSLHADIDHCGPMTRTVRDNAALLEAIAGPDGYDDRQPYTMIPETLKFTTHVDEFLAKSKDASKPLASFKIGVLKEGFEMSVLDGHVNKAVRSAIEDLKSLGAEIVEVSIPEHNQICGAWTCVQALAGSRDGLLGDQTGRKGLQMTDRAANYEPVLSQEKFDSLGAGAKNLYLKHLFVMEKYGILVHAKATNIIRRQTRAYDAVLSSLDALVMPTIPFPPPRIFMKDEKVSPLQRLLRVAGTVLNTAPFNATGHPALTIPVGFVPAQDDAEIKLPTGLQIVGKHFDETACFKIAAAWERSQDWKKLSF